jgi:hypothetical protein
MNSPPKTENNKLFLHNLAYFSTAFLHFYISCFLDSHGLMFFEKVLGGLTVVVKSPCYDVGKIKGVVSIMKTLKLINTLNHQLS